MRDSINTVESLIDYSIELGHNVLAITEHDTIASSIRAEKYYNKVKKDNPDFKLIRGNEIYLVRNGLNKDNFNKEVDRYFHFILLACDEVGHKQIREISTRAWMRSWMARGMRRVPTYYQDLIDIINKEPGHVIGCTACLGGCLPTQLIRNRDAGAPSMDLIKQWITQMQGIFGKENFYFEMQPSFNKDQIYVNHKLVELGAELGIKYIITNDAHYLRKADRPIHKAFLNSQKGDREVDDFYATTYLMSTEEIEHYMLEEMGEEVLQSAYETINEIKDKCKDYSLMKPLNIPRLNWKRFELTHNKDFYIDKIPYLKKFYESDYSEDRHLACAIINRLEEATAEEDLDNQKTYDEINACLEDTWISSEVNGSRWSAYFLNLQNIIDACWEAGTLVGAGRGCFIPGTKVTLSDGTTKNIEDIREGDKVFTHLGRIRPVIRTMNYDVEEELYNLKIQGTEEITCTDNHRFWAIPNIYCKYKDNCLFSCKRKCNSKNALKPRWVKAKDLKPKDMVAIPKYQYCRKEIEYLDLKDYAELINYYTYDEYTINTYKGNNTTNLRNSYQRFIKIDANFMYFLGVFIGDGWVRNRYNYSEIGIAFNSSTEKDQKSQDKIMKYLTSLGIEFKIIQNQNGKKVNQLVFHNPFLGLFLKKNCGDGAKNKHIPLQMLFDNREEMESLLYGLLNSDGCISKKEKRISYDTINYNLATQVRNLLSYLGLYSSTRIRSAYDNCQTSYKISSSGKQLSLLSFLDFCGQKNMIQRDDNYFYPRIEKININHYKGKVYDLSVKEDTSYIVNNIAVHNSGVGFILLYLLGITQINPLREKTKTYRFRFLNPYRVSPLDIDVDIEGSKRFKVLTHFRQIYGEDRVANVLTLRTEKSKSAILTAARGLGIDVDTAQYISSFIQSDRGMLRTLKQTYYGDEEEGVAPSKQFKKEMDENYPELWKVAQGIEGLINGCGIHAGGVIFVDEPFTESTALMRAPDGTIITQFDLHDAEATGLIKYDILSIEALDKIHNCIDLLCEYGYEEREETLKETYEKIIGIYNLERENSEMWKLCWEHKVQSLFQMEADSGIRGIALMKPESVDDLAILNSAIRLMATEKGGEMPVNKLARFKAHPSDWDCELKKYGLGEEEKKILEPIIGISYGLCISQEQFMKLVQLPEIGGFDLIWSDKLRKAVAKKSPLDYEKLEKEFFKNAKEKKLNKNLCWYVWNILIAMSRGYSFNASHTLSYSLIGLQELNLVFHYPIIFWNCACLISDSGGNEDSNDREEEDREDSWEEFDDVSMGTFEENNGGQPTDISDDSSKTNNSVKKKTRTINYGKISTAIGKFISEGIKINPPDINLSRYTFSPDLENNAIIYGLNGIVKVGEEIVDNIIENRPYTSINNFLSKVKINKPQMVNLIKTGAFDNLYKDREEAMKVYIDLAAEKKKRVTLQNMKMLIDFNLIPKEYEFECKVYNFNKYLKKFKEDKYYKLNSTAFRFYEENFDLDLLIPSDEEWLIEQSKWDKIYKKHMDIIRPYVKENNQYLLDSINNKLVKDLWDKYCKGNISSWEMDSLSCYIHDHELKNINYGRYGLVDYFKLPEEPIIDYEFTAKDTGKKVPMYKIMRIAGTVLDKDKNKKTVTLLTREGVVNVKIFGDAFTNYDKQISEKRLDGTKKVLEKSWFSRGNKVIVTGIKRDGVFLGKKYKSTKHHLVELITEIDKDSIKVQEERIEV